MYTTGYSTSYQVGVVWSKVGMASKTSLIKVHLFLCIFARAHVGHACENFPTFLEALTALLGPNAPCLDPLLGPNDPCLDLTPPPWTQLPSLDAMPPPWTYNTDPPAL